MYEAIRSILNSKDFSVTEAFAIESSPARYAEIPAFLGDGPLGAYLSRHYPSGLWSHQAKALEMLGSGDNIVISTGTASGKSLVFQSFALHKVVQSPFQPGRRILSTQSVGIGSTPRLERNRPGNWP